jgi:hypothetical protein
VLRLLKLRTREARVRNWMAQIVIGLIVTVVGSVIANAIIKGSGGKHGFSRSSAHWGPARAGR